MRKYAFIYMLFLMFALYILDRIILYHPIRIDMLVDTSHEDGPAMNHSESVIRSNASELEATSSISKQILVLQHYLS